MTTPLPGHVQTAANVGSGTISAEFADPPTEGNLLVAWIARQGVGYDFTPQFGYAALSVLVGLDTAQMFWKLAEAEEPATQLPAIGGAGNWACTVVEYAGYEPPDVEAMGAATGAAFPTKNAPAVTPTPDVPALVVAASMIRVAGVTFSNQTVTGANLGPVTDRQQLSSGDPVTAPISGTSTALWDAFTTETAGSYGASVVTSPAENGGAGIAVFPAIPPVPPPELEVLTAELPDGAVGQAYQTALTATGGDPPYAWTADPLPDGLAVEDETIAGVPTTAGTWTVELTVTDAANRTATAQRLLTVAEAPPPPPPPPTERLVPIDWDGLPLNPGEVDGGLLAVVTNLTGWYDTPAADGHNVDLALADGQARGPKTLAARTLTVEGAAVGDREQLRVYRDQLAMRATARTPAEFAVTGPILGRLSCEVRADTESLQHAFIGGAQGFRYTVTLTAADPRVYGPEQVALLQPGTGDSGRDYPREYPWAYAEGSLPNQARLTNLGTAPAPVLAAFTGPLTSPRIDNGAGQILLSTLADGVMILVDTERLAAYAPGGASRGSTIRPGSTPMTVPAETTQPWSLYAVGTGFVQLVWRSAWL